MNIAEFEKVLDAAVEAARSRGIKISTNEYGVVFDDLSEEWVCDTDVDNCCCPLGALILKEKPTVTGDVDFLQEHYALEVVRRYLGDAEMKWVHGFINGFDGDSFVNGAHDPAAFDLGTRLRRRYVGD